MVTALATLVHIVHYAGREQSGHIHHSCYTLSYILLQHLTKVITIDTVHMTNSVAFTSVAIHNVTYSYSTLLTLSQSTQYTLSTQSRSL